MKKELLLFFTLFLSIGFVSSQGLSDLLNSLDQSTILLFAVFIVSFSIIFFALNRAFKKENTAISGIISVVIAFMIVYGLSRSGFSLENSLLDIGISQEALGVIIPLIIVAGVIFLIIKLAKDSLIVIGGLLIVLSFFVYARLLLIAIGGILIIVRFFIPKDAWKRPEKKGYNNRGAGI